MDSDFLLVLRMKRGDLEALDSFVRKYYPLILRYCFAHMPNKSDAEDMAQETFARFFRSFRDYHHQGKALHYLYVIASHVCADFARQQTPSEELSEQMEAECADVDSVIAVRQAVYSLAEELREVTILYYLQDLSQKEIAKILSIGLPLVKYRLRRAKEQLRIVLAEEEEQWRKG